MQVLLDHSCPRPVLRLLTRHTVQTAADLGWHDLSNGKLLAAAEASGFECMVTSDQNLAHQQRLDRYRLALVVLSTNTWHVIKALPDLVIDAVDRAAPGSYETVMFPRPPLRRRPYVSPGP